MSAVTLTLLLSYSVRNVFVMSAAARATVGPSGDDTAADGDKLESNSLLLVVSGVCLCVLVVLLSVVFVVHQQWKARQLARKLITPAHEALLARTDQQTQADRRPASAAAANDSTDHSQQYDWICFTALLHGFLSFEISGEATLFSRP